MSICIINEYMIISYNIKIYVYINIRIWKVYECSCVNKWLYRMSTEDEHMQLNIFETCFKVAYK